MESWLYSCGIVVVFLFSVVPLEKLLSLSAFLLFFFGISGISSSTSGASNKAGKSEGFGINMLVKDGKSW